MVCAALRSLTSRPSGKAALDHEHAAIEQRNRAVAAEETATDRRRARSGLAARQPCRYLTKFARNFVKLAALHWGMPSPTYYRSQAHRCLLLSRSTVDPRARQWLTDMASYYADKARRIAENGVDLTVQSVDVRDRGVASDARH